MLNSSPEPQVVFEEWPARMGGIGVIRLNHPKALNSLTLAMVESIAGRLSSWENNDEIGLIVMHSSNERAFCAGGDVKTVALKIFDNEPTYPAQFFRWEYKMDYLIRTFRKPILAWGDGIVMGGGLGMFSGASHGVVTERSVLAMPEITIGFFPDVGASYFLSRLPDGIGLFLGWTAARLSPADALWAGLAKVAIASSDKEVVFSELRAADWSKPSNGSGQKLSEIIDRFALDCGPSKLRALAPKIQDALANVSVSEARAALLEMDERDPWLRDSIRAFSAGSPLSAHIIFEQLRRARGLSVLDAFVFEWGMASRMCEGRDFPEGVRALLIDKDQKPKWQFNDFLEVAREPVERTFEPLPEVNEIREFFFAR